ncbi:hypothetical protein AD938_12480 [Gluconobacter japonicus]|nr:hypothetical protein AD938_12480 [Gluconobacter japonicus]
MLQSLDRNSHGFCLKDIASCKHVDQKYNAPKPKKDAFRIAQTYFVMSCFIPRKKIVFSTTSSQFLSSNQVTNYTTQDYF